MNDFKRAGKIHRLAERLKVSKRTVYRWIREEVINLDLLYAEVMNGEWVKVRDLANVVDVPLATFYNNVDSLNGVLRVGRTLRINIKTSQRVSKGNI